LAARGLVTQQAVNGQIGTINPALAPHPPQSTRNNLKKGKIFICLARPWTLLSLKKTAGRQLKITLAQESGVFIFCQL